MDFLIPKLYAQVLERKLIAGLMPKHVHTHWLETPPRDKLMQAHRLRRRRRRKVKLMQTEDKTARPRPVVRYSVIVVRADLPEPQVIISDYWQGKVEYDVYVKSRLSVYQVFCPLGRGYFGV